MCKRLVGEELVYGDSIGALDVGDKRTPDTAGDAARELASDLDSCMVRHLAAMASSVCCSSVRARGATGGRPVETAVIAVEVGAATSNRRRSASARSRSSRACSPEELCDNRARTRAERAATDNIDIDDMSDRAVDSVGEGGEFVSRFAVDGADVGDCNGNTEPTASSSIATVAADTEVSMLMDFAVGSVSS
jgi:hypothetical protein